MKISEVADLAGGLKGVRRTVSGGLMQWRYHGRLVARQLDDAHIVIRAGFDYRDAVVRQFPATFSVPARFVKHMMVVADLSAAEAGAIEGALIAANGTRSLFKRAGFEFVRSKGMGNCVMRRTLC